jgi:hypothetical protein
MGARVEMLSDSNAGLDVSADDSQVHTIIYDRRNLSVMLQLKYYTYII